MQRYKELVKTEHHADSQPRTPKVGNWVPEEPKIIGSRSSPPAHPVELPVKDTAPVSKDEKPEEKWQTATVYHPPKRDESNKSCGRVAPPDFDFSGDMTEKVRGRKHFKIPCEDQVATILEHPLSHYTSTNESVGESSVRHNHRDENERQRCARR